MTKQGNPARGWGTPKTSTTLIPMLDNCSVVLEPRMGGGTWDRGVVRGVGDGTRDGVVVPRVG